MATAFDNCGICTSRHFSKLSVVWCSDCDEGLCQDCTEHHSLSKSSRYHKTVPIGEYHKLPSFIANIKLQCDEHDEKYQLFCKDHNKVLCRKCAISAKHKECKAIFPVEEVILNAKTSVAFTEIESSLQEMKENLRLILEDRQKNVSSLLDSKKKLESEVSAIRHQINQHIDQIQDQFIAELNKAVEHSTQHIQSFIASLKNNQKEIDECIDDVKNIKNHATDMQTFLGINQLVNKLNKTENEMQSWTDGNSLGLTVVCYHINTLLQTISNDITTFGKSVVDVKHCELALQRRKEGQAQLMKVNVGPKCIVKNIRLELKTKIKTTLLNVSGCCILPCGKLVISNYDPSYLIVLAPDGKIEKTITNIMSKIYDVTCVDDETVAVISSKEPNIKLVGLTSGKSFRTINTTSPSLGITYAKCSFIVCPKKGHLQEIMLKDNMTNNIGSPIDSEYVASLDNTIYHRKKSTDEIVWDNRNGDILWTFSNDTVLKGPRCITVDENGSIFVAGGKSNNIVVIDSEGRDHKILLSEKDLCGSPWAIDYNSKLNCLLVANEKDGQAFLYSVNYA
ncbi:uncharacterized protein [Mytilus edulis]|uniref:uncharacterized protein n=1 Tax=Mytilus edulis TaxID=6550 RepID=UPI0039EF6B2F